MSSNPNKKKAIRRTYTFTEADLAIIENIKDKLLDKKQVVTDSQIIRMGLISLTSYAEKNLVELILEAPLLTKRAK